MLGSRRRDSSKLWLEFEIGEESCVRVRCLLDTSHFQGSPLIPHSRFTARLSEMLAGCPALSHELVHLWEDLLSACWVCSIENMSAKLIEGLCSGDWEILITGIVSEQGWLGLWCILSGKKDRSLKTTTKNNLAEWWQVQLWEGAGVWAEEQDCFPPTEWGSPPAGPWLTPAPLLRNRRLISPVLNESVWKNCWENTKNKWDGGMVEKRQGLQCALRWLVREII